MTGVKLKNRRTGRAWRDGQAETADAADNRMRQESIKASAKYMRLLIAAGHLDVRTRTVWPSHSSPAIRKQPGRYRPAP